MKEDILEQIGNDWILRQEGQFTKTNIKYRPSINHPSYVKSTDSIHSDIDILAINTKEIDTVTVINCKAWMDGFDFKIFNDHLTDKNKHNDLFGGKEYWKHFRDIIDPKWNAAFIDAIKKENPSFINLRYIILCVYASNKASIADWVKNPIINNNFASTGINLLSIEAIELKELVSQINVKGTDYAENSEISRMLQLFIAAKIL
jgi:hypothetical protein